MTKKCLIGIVHVFCFLIVTPVLVAREWKDKTGQYTVEAELVSSNNSLVVLRTPSHKLIALELGQLSNDDQDYIRSQAVKKPDPLKESKDLERTEPSISDGKPLAQNETTTEGGWRLIDGQTLKGEFLGFDLEPLVIQRKLSEVYVGGVAFNKLDPIYQRILPMMIAHLEKVNIEDVRDIQQWLKKSGPGPWTYKIESVMIETPTHGTVRIPTFLLSKQTADTIALPLKRWREALLPEVTAEERSSYFDRERFMTRASMSAQQADAQVEQQARFLRLELLAVASGATDLWEVTLIPRIGYGYPYRVLVTGQNSLEAQQAAVLRFPGYTVGGVAKHTR